MIVRVATGTDVGPQAFVGDRPQASLVQPIVYRGRPRNKAQGGIWTSPLIDGATSAWALSEHASSAADLWRLDPDPLARLVLIDSLADLRALLDSHRLAIEDGFLPIDEPVIDYERLRDEGYDGVYLSERGEDETRHSFPVGLYGWDVASIHWFRWRFVGEPALLGGGPS